MLWQTPGRPSKRRTTLPSNGTYASSLCGRRASCLSFSFVRMSDDLLALFRKTGALLDGHFVLRSGLHSRQYFQCAILLQHTDIAAQECGQHANELRQFYCYTVILPALGVMIV